MFCYQCQETAQGKGCTLKGVCGKTAEVAGLQDLLMYLMKGISKLTTTLRKQGVESSTANKFIVDGLFMTITNANFDSSRFVSKIKEAYQLRENLLNELHRLGIHLSLTCDCLTWKSDKVEEMAVIIIPAVRKNAKRSRYSCHRKRGYPFSMRITHLWG